MWSENIFGEQMGDEEMGTDDVKGGGTPPGIYEGPVQYPGEEATFRKTGAGEVQAGKGAVSVVKGAGQEAVKAMQRALTAAGCDSGTIDGIIGPITRSAMTCFINRYGHAAFSQRFPAFAQEPTRQLGTRPTAPRPAAPRNGAPASAGNGVVAPPMPPMTTMSMMAGDWRIWAAAGGVAVLGYVGYRYYKQQKRKEIFRNMMEY